MAGIEQRWKRWLRPLPLALALALALHLGILLYILIRQPDAMKIPLKSLQVKLVALRSGTPAPAPVTTAPAATTPPLHKPPVPAQQPHSSLPSAHTSTSIHVLAPLVATRPLEKPARLSVKTPLPRAALPAPAGNSTISNAATIPAKHYGDLLADWIKGNQDYPEKAQERHIEGEALLELTLAQDGTILRWEFLKHTEAPALDEAIIRNMAANRSAPPIPASEKQRVFRVPVFFRIVAETSQTP